MFGEVVEVEDTDHWEFTVSILIYRKIYDSGFLLLERNARNEG